VSVAPERPDPSLGVFETLFIRDRATQALGRHMRRMRRSTERLYGLLPRPDLAARIRAEAARLGDGEHRLRVDARPVGKELRFTFEATALAPRPALWRLAPLPLAGGYGPDKLVDRGPLQSSAAGGPVALLVDGAGADAEVLEAGWANVWLLDGDRLITPPCDGRILPGVTRARAIELAPAFGLSVSEQPIRLGQLRAAAMMLTSSLQLAAPAVLEGSPEPGPVAIAAIGRLRAALLAGDWDR
jgi:para-aminobenzoate synthetase / 4-amino-4-deoxychorismate lyase